ncbi:uncharacterized protein [Atheta coriaria]|uniref:uncharacterized protein n=1 Tax=Dalotia coriaria TaxID=877792 RepID=UPI0031F36979
MLRKCPKNSNVVTLAWSDDTQCSINVHGCTVTSWRVKNWEQLFLSRHAKLNQRKEIMGGVSIAFPKYGGWKFGPPNGFACISKWKLIKGPVLDKDTQDIVAVFELVDNPHTRSFWNFQFKITNTIRLSEYCLEIKSHIQNTSPVLPMRFNLMYPMFIKVPNVETIQIVGMNNVQYNDETIKEDDVLRTDRKKAIEITAWTYRIYKQAPSTVDIFHVTSDCRMRVENSGLQDFIVWNPWDDHGSQVDDFRPEQYKEMICIGMGNINEEMRLEPGEDDNFRINLEIVKERRSRFY